MATHLRRASIARQARWLSVQHALYCRRESDSTTGPMPQITYIEHDGTTHQVEAEVGSTVMETAIRNGITGIVAECGGACSCATCHVDVDEGWFGRLPKRSPEEEGMLDFAFEAKPTSRLSCQIKIEPALDGLVVRTPAYQGQ